MKKDRPSKTAEMVAFFRAAADAGYVTAKGFSDPFAKRFLTGRWERLFKRLKPGATLGRATQSGADLLALRTLAIDAALAAAGTPPQLVILGAGLDARAFRLSALAATRVFEVDHPATQRFKKERVEGLKPAAKELHFVTVDFESERLGHALSSAGHDPTQRTTWIWEGVVMYLSDAAMRSTLAEIAAASAPGSTLIVNYNVPAPQPGTTLMNLLLRFWSEPQIGLRSTETMAKELEAAGFRVTEDTNVVEWAKRFQGQLPTFGTALRSRLAVAKK